MFTKKKLECVGCVVGCGKLWNSQLQLFDNISFSRSEVTL